MEVIDGHRCLRVQLNYLPALKVAFGPKVRFWIDLARGGHPLRVEFHSGPRFVGLIRDILLGRFKLPGGGEVWLPIQGVRESFGLNKKSYPDPVTRKPITLFRIRYV